MQKVAKTNNHLKNKNYLNPRLRKLQSHIQKESRDQTIATVIVSLAVSFRVFLCLFLKPLNLLGVKLRCRVVDQLLVMRMLPTLEEQHRSFSR